MRIQYCYSHPPPPARLLGRDEFEKRCKRVEESLHPYADAEILFSSDAGNILTWLIMNPVWIALSGLTHTW